MQARAQRRVWVSLIYLLSLLSLQIHLWPRWAPAPRQGNPVTPVWMRRRLVTLTRRVNVSDLPITPSAARPRPRSPLRAIRSRVAGSDVRRWVQHLKFKGKSWSSEKTAQRSAQLHEAQLNFTLSQSVDKKKKTPNLSTTASCSSVKGRECGKCSREVV